MAPKRDDAPTELICLLASLGASDASLQMMHSMQRMTVLMTTMMVVVMMMMEVMMAVKIMMPVMMIVMMMTVINTMITHGNLRPMITTTMIGLIFAWTSSILVKRKSRDRLGILVYCLRLVFCLHPYLDSMLLFTTARIL